jgi:hypothetical protein
MKVSSASTIPVSLVGLSSAGACKNRCRHRKAVDAATPQRFAALARLSPANIASACAAQRSFLRSRANGVPVKPLKLRRQPLHR